MKARKTSRRKPRRRFRSIDRNEGLALLGARLATRLTRSWGPRRAIIAFVAIFSIVATQIARSDFTVIGIVVIAVVAMLTAFLSLK